MAANLIRTSTTASATHMIRLAHVSDFHLGDGLLAMDHRAVGPLSEDLASFHEDAPITAIVCSGDLIDRGGKSFESPGAAFDAFAERVADPILERLGMDRSRFVIVPGNHDAVRSADSRIVDTGLRTELSDATTLDRYLAEADQEGVERMRAFAEFRRRFYDRVGQPLSVGARFAQFRYEVDGVVAGIAALDTAWRCYGSDTEDSEALLLGERTVLSAIKGLEPCDIRVAVHHHPLRYLAPFDREIVEPMIEREFDLALLGHVHSGDAVATDRATGLLFVSTAPGVLRGKRARERQPLCQRVSCH